MEHEEDTAIINNDVMRAFGGSLVVVVAIIALVAAVVPFLPTKKTGEESFSVSIKNPKYLPGCGSSADISDIVAELVPKHPNHHITIGKIRTYKKDELISTRECIGAATIILTPKFIPKPETLGGEMRRMFESQPSIAEKRRESEYLRQDGFGYWCKSDDPSAFTEVATTRLLDDFKRKHATNREVVTVKIFKPESGEKYAVYCIIYQPKSPATPPRRLGNTLAFAGVFCSVV